MTVKTTQAVGHAMELAQQAADAGYGLVLAAGGDGTLGEVANGLAGTKAVMAPLPLGTGNSFAKELQMPRPSLWDQHKLLQAADALAAGRVHYMDLGYTYGGSGDDDGRYWLLWTGTGADGYLVSELEPRPKWSKKLGAVGYAMQGMMALSRFPGMKATVNVDGRVYRGGFLVITVSNCRLYAGGEIALNPQAKLDDGLFEVWMFRGHSLPQILRYLLEVRLGRHQKNPDVTMVNGRHVSVYTYPVMPCHTDGERAGNTPLVCEMKPGALRVLIPETAPGDLFNGPGTELSA